MISAIVFTFWPEEENYIEACLQSVAWADEIIVVDNGATEKTLTIAKKFTKKIFSESSKSFALRHNLGTEKATGDWLLFIDSDERVSLKLKEEIMDVVSNLDFDAYELNRINYFLGKKLRFGDRNPDYIARLFRKSKLKIWSGEIHESSQVDGKIGRLSAPLYHLTHRDIFTMVQKTINFSEHEAVLRLQSRHPPVVGWRLCRIFLTEFYTRIIKFQGWRQGTEGWIDGIFQAFSMFVVYVRLWELQRKQPLVETYKEIDRKILEGTL